MPSGTGLDSQIGFSKEAVYGTRVVPAKFLEFRSESFNFEKNYIMSRQLGAGSTFQSSSRRSATTKSGSGQITVEAPSKGLSALLDLIHPNTPTVVQQAATPAYLHTHNIGLGTATKSASFQVGRPSTDGTVRPFDYLGCMVTEWGFSWDTSDFLMFNQSFDAQDEKTDQTLATRTLPTGIESFNFTQGTLTIGGATVADVGSGSITGGQPLKTDRYYLGNTGLKAKPLQNDFATASGTFSADFTDLTHYNRFTAGTVAAVVLTFTGSQISGIYNHTVKITLSACGFNGETPNVDGPDILNQSIPFVAMYNGSDPPVKVEVTTTDVTL